MLYKKIHRQHLREFKRGRIFKIDNDTKCEVEKPYIDEECNAIYVRGTMSWRLIPMYGKYSGKLWLKNRITWCSD